MKNKRNKLQIKENWKKGLTISLNDMDQLRGGTDNSGNPFCGSCGVNNTETVDTENAKCRLSADCNK